MAPKKAQPNTRQLLANAPCEYGFGIRQECAPKAPRGRQKKTGAEQQKYNRSLTIRLGFVLCFVVLQVPGIKQTPNCSTYRGVVVPATVTYIEN